MHPSRFFLTIAVAALLCGSAPVLAGTHRVPADFATIQAAIDAANAGDVILLADGVYSGAGNRDIDFGGKAVVVRSENGADNCVIDCGGSLGDPHRAFWFHSGETAAARLEGLTIRGGFMNRGGGILCENGSSPTIVACIVRDNTAWAVADNDGGAGVFLSGSHPTIVDCLFLQNHAELTVNLTNGGAMCIAFGSNPVIRECEFWRNSATGVAVDFGGGAIQIGRTSAPLISDCVFAENVANEGGALRIVTIQEITISRCIFQENTALLFAGAAVTGNPGRRHFRDCLFYRNRTTDPNLEGGAGLVLMDGEDSAVNCRFIENSSARIGGGLWLNRGVRATVDRCEFLGNCSGDRAAGMAVSQGSEALITSCIFVGNSSGLFSSAGASALDCFAGINAIPAFATLRNCTFSHNTAPAGHAAIASWAGSGITASNCIFRLNSPAAFGGNSGVSATYSCFGSPFPGDGNVTANPLFTRDPNPGAGGWCVGRDDNDYGDLRLSALSPCIDAGDPAFVPTPCEHDLDGACRVWDGNADGGVRVDMGGYEFGAPRGDIDGNCQIDLGDLAALLTHFGTLSGAQLADGDVDRDGDVDLTDLSLLLAHFGSTCP